MVIYATICFAFSIFVSSMLLSGAIAWHKGYDVFLWFFLGGMFNIGTVITIILLPDRLRKTRKTLNKYIAICNANTMNDYDSDCVPNFIKNNKKKYRLKGV